jgi:hypothetical protein
MSSQLPGTVGIGKHYLERGGRPFLPVGAHVVPVEGPDWPWRVGASSFEQYFEAMAAAGLDAARIDLLWAAIEPSPGEYDEQHLKALDQVLEAAHRHGILLHPTLFIGGEVGDAYWDVPWRDGRHPHRDRSMRALQVAHAEMLARRWRAHPAILAWDLTDEPPLWLFRDTDDEDARAWTREISRAIRAADPDHLVTVGTAGQDIAWGPFRADIIADDIGFACVHPYPIYEEELYPDGLLSTRMTHAAAFETSLAAGAGKPVMVHEYGASSAQFDPESIGRYDRLLAWSAFGRGAIGFFAWCWTDAEPDAYRRAPYVRQPHETQFGVTDHEGRLRPRGRVLGELAREVRALDLTNYAANGPAPADAAIVVPHEYVHPYDQAAYGLEGGGPYVPAETAWSPHREIGPLARAWLNAFVLAARSGLSASFPREGLNDRWPDVPLMLLPSPLTSTSSSHLHVRTSFWARATYRFQRGGTIYLSCSADAAIPQMDEIAGCRVADRAPADRPVLFRFVQRWGPFGVGDELELPVAQDGVDLQRRGVRLRLSDARVVAEDVGGDPAIVIADRGGGHAVTCAYPVESLLSHAPDAHGPADRSFGLYRGLADLAGIRPIVDHPDVTAGHLVGPMGGLIVATNHGPSDVDVELHLPNDIVQHLSIDAYGFAVRTYDLIP